jgi:tetratricopeptide (TPR) repeat protein
VHGAVKEYKRAIEMLSKVNERAGLGAAYHNLAVAYESLGELREAEGAFRKALSYAGEGSEHAARIQASLAGFYRRTGSEAKAEEELANARRSSIKSGFEEGQVETEVAIAQARIERREWQKAISLLRQTCGKVERAGEGGPRALRAMEGLITAYAGARDFASAKEWTGKALSLGRGDDEATARLHLQLSDIEEAMGDKTKALEALVKGECSAEKIPGARIAYALRKSEMQLSMGKEDDSLASAKEALATASREREHYAMARAHELAGEAYAKKGEKKLALNELEHAIDDFERANEPERAIRVRERIKKL